MPGISTALSQSRAPAACFTGMGIVWGTFMATMPDIRTALGVTDGAMGGLLIWGSVAAIAMMSIAPRLGTPLGRAALPGFALMMGLALALMAGAAGPLAFAMALAAMGAATGALDVFMNARLSAIEAARGHPLMNLNHALYSLGFAAAAALTGAARAGGWSVAAILTTAAVLVLALERIGHRNHALYDGSWAEWGMFNDLRVATGEA